MKHESFSETLIGGISVKGLKIHKCCICGLNTVQVQMVKI